MADERADLSLLAEFGELRRATRATAESWWYPMVVFGAVAVGAGLVSMANGAVQLAWWAAGLGAASIFTARFYRRRSTSVGVVAKHRHHWFLWLLITVAAFAVPIFAPVAAQAAAWFVVAVGYLAAAAMGQSARLAVLAGMLGAASAAIVASSASAMIADVACGFILIVSGLAARSAEYRP